MTVERSRRERLLFWAFALCIVALLIGRYAFSSDEQSAASMVVARYIADRGAPNARVVVDDGYRDTIVRAVYAQNVIRPELLLSMIYHESTFRDGVRGGRGECGLVQVGYAGVSHCSCECDGPPAAQIACAVCWYQAGAALCGGVERRALTAYMTGRCTDSTDRLRRKIESRLKLAETFRRLIDQEVKRGVK